MNIIGDIAGQYKALRRLLAKMPDDTPLSVGDMIDRGPESHKVLNFFMTYGKAVLGNHEHLMLDYFKKGYFYPSGIWFLNGGKKTFSKITIGGARKPLSDYISYLESLPYIIEIKGTDGNPDIVVTHAPIYNVEILNSIDPTILIGKSSTHITCDNGLLWNRNPATQIPNLLQIHGHNANTTSKVYGDPTSPFAINLDSSHGNILTGYSTITKTLYTEPF